MNKVVIIPHNNQLLLLKAAQTKLCRLINSSSPETDNVKAVPFFPIMVECSSLKADSKITKVELCDDEELISENSFFSAKVKLQTDGSETEGKIRLIRLLNFDRSKISPDIKKPELKLNSGIKKLSPLKLSEISIEETENTVQWSLSKEKWIKL